MKAAPRAKRIAGIISGPPFELELTLGEPERRELEDLWRKMTDPAFAPSKQAMWREAYRVAEVLYEKEHGPILAARRAIPLICDLQRDFLLTGNPRRLAEVSVEEVAAQAECSMFAIAQGVRGLAVRTPTGVVPVDRLLGPAGKRWRGVPVGYVETWCLIPTDDARDADAFKGFLEIFREGRENILDPVLVAEDPHRPLRAFVVQGHHRVAAAFATERKVRVALLRTIEELRGHLREGLVADLAQRCNIEEFVEECEARSRRRGLYQGRWDTWMTGLPTM